MIDILLDALLDTLKLMPFLYLVYMLIGYFERNTDNILYQKLTKAKWSGPILGALIGCVPQCGFSVVGANLYSKKMIGLGTLVAIFISTSDEAIPILLAHPNMLSIVGIVLVLKVGIAILVGCSLEALAYLIQKKSVTAHPDGTLILQEESFNHHTTCTCSYTCGCESHSKNTSLFLVALRHTIRISLFIFAINFILNSLIEGAGEGLIESILLTDNIFQPALAALIGMIPNCASSIMLTEMFVAGSLSLGSLIAGLSTGAGIGLVILFKTNKNLKDNLKILAVLYGAGTICGMLLQLF